MRLRPKLLSQLAILILVAAWIWLRHPRSEVDETPEPAQGQVAPSGKYTPSQLPPPKGGASADELKRAARNYIREVGPGEVQIGTVRLNKRLRTISLPATIAEKERPLEYALVHESGKAHEALFVTQTAAQDVHVAALLIDASGLSPKIEVTWRKHGGEAKVALHELIGMKGGSLDGVWRYNGSQFMHGGFAAAREGSFVALVNDPAALVNHPAAGALMKDDVFFALTAKLPPGGVQVTVVMTFPDQP